jgi:hypothetical protein
MKNKHLVLLALGILIALGLSRWAPKCGKDTFSVRLLSVEPSQIVRMTCADPYGGQVFLTLADDGWLVSREADQPELLRDSIGKDFLSKLVALSATKVLNSNRLDTLGFSLATMPHVRIQYRNSKEEDMLFLGKTFLHDGQPATWAMTSRDRQSYLVTGDLRKVLRIDYDQLSGKAYRFDTKLIRSMSIESARDTLTCEGDSIWYMAGKATPMTGTDSLYRWFKIIEKGASGARDNTFDETRKQTNHCATLHFTDNMAQSLTLRLYRADTPAPSDDSRPVSGLKPTIVVEHAEQPGRYTTLGDTTVILPQLSQIQHYLRRVSMPPRAINRSNRLPNGR